MSEVLPLADVVPVLLGGLVVFGWVVLCYALALNSSYLVLLACAASETRQALRRPDDGAHDDVFANPLTPAISVVMTAFNEEANVLECVRAALGLRYPQHEVVIVDDGSTDATFEVLRAEYDLVESTRPLDDVFPTVGAVRSVYEPRGTEPLLVIRKENARRRADGINTALNAARYPLVCCIDADSILEVDALLRAVKPFVDDPDRVIATGGAIRAANGATVQRGRVTSVRQPRSWYARIQVIEYLRSFHLGRVGWSRLGGLLLISGAFGLYRRDRLARIGGFDVRSLGEDLDALVALHRDHRDRKVDYRVVFVPQPANWTEVPNTHVVLARQRRRWSHGLAQVLWKQRGMIGNPRYGRIGLVAMPYYLLFELFGPVVELLGLVAVVLGVALGVVSLPFAVLYAMAWALYGIVLSVMALLIEEVGFHRYTRWRDLLIGLGAAVAEFLGYRQLHAWWRLKGLFSALRGGSAGWGEMPRTGFGSEGNPA